MTDNLEKKIMNLNISYEEVKNLLLRKKKA